MRLRRLRREARWLNRGYLRLFPFGNGLISFNQGTGSALRCARWLFHSVPLSEFILKQFVLCLVVGVLLGAQAWACDACGCSLHQPILFSGVAEGKSAVSSPGAAKVDEGRGDAKNVVAVRAVRPDAAYWFGGIDEQFTSFGTLQSGGGHRVDNSAGQYEQSSTTQVYGGWQFNDWASLQLNVPIVNRQFRRPDGNGGIDQGNVSGFGDASLVANFVPYRTRAGEWDFAWTVGGGVKFPTGDWSRLREELGGGGNGVGPDSAIGGHDLALGSGSFDGLVATGISLRREAFFWDSEMQYAIRTAGALGYRYANEIAWAGGPGVTFWKKNDLAAGLQFRISGSSKGQDSLPGVDETDTAMTSVYLGPKFTVEWKERLSGHFGVDLPVILDNDGLQAVPDYRVQAGVTWRF